ncbi:hypothetical protein ACTXT7_010851, partial [Hymenolepis weldensis]
MTISSTLPPSSWIASVRPTRRVCNLLLQANIQTLIAPKRNRDTNLTAKELQLAKCQLNLPKGSGLNGVRSELLKWSESSLDKLLLRYFNDCWQSKYSTPRSWVVAEVINIYKGKRVRTDLANYRSIFLLDTA